jgi:hypothetical protein
MPDLINDIRAKIMVSCHKSLMLKEKLLRFNNVVLLTWIALRTYLSLRGVIYVFNNIT